MKNAFYFTLKAHFILKIFKSIFVLFFFAIEKKRLAWKDKVNFKVYGVKSWLTNNYNTHVVQYLTK